MKFSDSSSHLISSNCATPQLSPKSRCQREEKCYFSELQVQVFKNLDEESFQKWLDLYKKTLENKNRFLAKNGSKFEAFLKQSPEEFAREPVGSCDQLNALFSYMQPRLAKDQFMARGKFYRTEKLIIRKFYQPFQRGSVKQAKQLVWHYQEQLGQLFRSSPDLQRILKSILVDDNEHIPCFLTEDTT